MVPASPWHWPLVVAPSRIAYVAVFALVAAVCFVAIGRTRTIEDRDTRRGLIALLVTSGIWALVQAGALATTDRLVTVVLHEIGLTVGLATVGAWLYFTSAYTDRTLHRDRTIRLATVGGYLAVIALKVTNPWHGLYFDVVEVTRPFVHVGVTYGVIHWTIMGASYALAAVGFFMLFERFHSVSHDTRPLAALVLLTGLPVVFDVAALHVPGLVAVNYEPLGVAAFAVGVLFVFSGRFRTVRLAGERDDPVIVLDDEGAIRDYNGQAEALVPALADRDVIGTPFETVAPSLAGRIAGGDSILRLSFDGDRRYFRVTDHTFSGGQSSLGRALVFTDVTEHEQYRRELERQNQRLETFASMLSHDLRNPLNVAQARLELFEADDDDDHLETASEALDRIETLIEDVLELARGGQPVEDPDPVSVATVARDAWSMVETADATLEVADAPTVAADPDRLQQLFENLFRNTVEHGGETVTITVGPLASGRGFFVADDGRGIPSEDHETVFESGYTTAEGGTGFGLSIVAEIVAAHGWSIALADVETGTRFEIRT